MQHIICAYHMTFDIFGMVIPAAWSIVIVGVTWGKWNFCLGVKVVRLVSLLVIDVPIIFCHLG